MLAVNLEDYLDTRSMDKAAELYEVISRPTLKVRDTGISYRTINHWDEMKLIRFNKNVSDGNRFFSFSDWLWIKVVEQLRSFGISLPIIQKIAHEIYTSLPYSEMVEGFLQNPFALNTLNNFSIEDKEGFLEFLQSGEYKKVDELGLSFNALHLLIAETILSNKPSTLIVFNDGEWFPYFKEKESLYPDELLHKKDFSSQVRINLSDLIYSAIKQDSLLSYTRDMQLFLPVEQQLIDIVKSGRYQKILVLLKSKKHLPIEITKSKEALSQLLIVFHEKKYREFILTDNKGKEKRITENLTTKS
jgi:hypothetical protein